LPALYSDDLLGVRKWEVTMRFGGQQRGPQPRLWSLLVWGCLGLMLGSGTSAAQSVNVTRSSLGLPENLWLKGGSHLFPEGIEARYFINPALNHQKQLHDRLKEAWKGTGQEDAVAALTAEHRGLLVFHVAVDEVAVLFLKEIFGRGKVDSAETLGELILDEPKSLYLLTFDALPTLTDDKQLACQLLVRMFRLRIRHEGRKRTLEHCELCYEDRATALVPGPDHGNWQARIEAAIFDALRNRIALSMCTAMKLRGRLTGGRDDLVAPSSCTLGDWR
jgi:hypothetical protein